MDMKRSAAFSKCRTYRYALWRAWHADIPYAMFIGLNPSIADEERDDPTLRRCIGYAMDWGFGAVVIGNLFAYRATRPAEMMKVSDPIGPQNDYWLMQLASEAGIIVAAWENGGSFRERASQLLDKLPNLHILALNKSGQPSHPLYLKRGMRPFRLSGRGDR